jgi:hypothetical protein
MKLKDITEWSKRWSTPSGSLEANAAVEDGVLVDLSRWVCSSSVSLLNARMASTSARSEYRAMYTTRSLSF